MARRYHWLGEKVEDFVCEPHAAVCCDARGETLNLVARDSEGTRQGSAELARQTPVKTLVEIDRLRTLALPRRHEVELADVNPKRLASIFLKTYDAQPAGFEDLLGLAGVGAKTLRALSLLAELVYGCVPSTEDPARFSFAHGGKDGTPFPVERATYDRSIATLEKAIRAAKLGRADELAAFKRLARAFPAETAPSRGA